MKKFLPLIVLAVAPGMLSSFAAKAADAVGVSTLTVALPERNGTMEATLWYPAMTGGVPVRIGANAFFQGVPAWRDAPATKDARPLILLSQGGLRSGPNIGAWMAARLAMRGYAVAMLRQPDPHSQLPQKMLHEIWLRPADISATMTALENNSTLPVRIDAERVGALGFQLGGTAALALAGARLDPQSFTRSCDPGGNGVDCSWFAKVGLDLRAIDATRLARSNQDKRIKTIVVVDPELSTNFNATSLATITIPVRAINLGSPATIWPGLNAAGLASAVPNLSYDIVPGATQFSSFGECKPRAAMILHEEGEEPLCDDLPERSRAEIHDQLAAMVDAALRPVLSP